MSLYSKNGSIPQPETDGTEGWIEVPNMPIATEGKEVIWWYPPGWLIRDVKPEQSLQTFNTYDLDGNITGSEEKMADWSWSHPKGCWIAYPLPVINVSSSDAVVDSTLLTTETTTISSADPTISLNVGTASDTISGGV